VKEVDGGCYVVTGSNQAQEGGKPEEWERAMASWRADPDTRAQADLVGTARESLGAILTGRKRATEALFPDSPLRLVEEIYQGNAIADYFNDAVGQIVAAFVEAGAAGGAGGTIRILEIGAGSGGTTGRVLRAIGGYRDRIAEYCYTDISHSFLRHGEE